MTRRSWAVPALAIVTGLLAVTAIVTVVVMLGMLPAADLAIIGRLFNLAE